MGGNVVVLVSLYSYLGLGLGFEIFILFLGVIRLVLFVC